MSKSDSKEYPYRLCEIRDCGGDLKKRWYVEFYVWDINADKLIRRRDYSINIHKTKDERTKAAKRLKKQIDGYLIKGYHYDNQKEAEEKAPLSKSTRIDKAVEYVNKIKISTSSERTGTAYNSFNKIFLEFLEAENYKHLPLSKINGMHMQSFILYLKEEQEVESNTTINNYRTWARSIFNYMVNHKIIEESPAASWKKLREQEGTHVPYSDAQRKKVSEHLAAHEPQLLQVAMFIYYTFCRPAELRRLQVKNIQQNKIYIPSKMKDDKKTVRISKNSKSNYVVIPEGLQILIEQLNLRSYPAEFYVFGKGGVPGPVPVGRSTWSNKYREIMRKLEIPEEVTLYSWKHTGVIKLYQAIKDIKKIQEQCRHYDVSITDRYLRSLGLFDNKEVQHQFPGFDE